MEEELIKVPKLRLAQLQSFTQSALNIVQGHTEVEPEIANVSTAFSSFKESMINIEIRSNKKDLDKSSRDREFHPIPLTVSGNESFFINVRELLQLCTNSS